MLVTNLTHATQPTEAPKNSQRKKLELVLFLVAPLRPNNPVKSTPLHVSEVLNFLVKYIEIEKNYYIFSMDK